MKTLKNKIFKSLVSGLLIITFLTQSALASDVIQFTRPVAEQMATELQFCKDVETYNSKTIDILNIKVEKYFNLSEEYKNKVTLLDQDKADLKLRGDKFEKVYTTCSDDLNKCKGEKPSRFVWYGAGFLSAVVVGIVSAFAFRK